MSPIENCSGTRGTRTVAFVPIGCCGGTEHYSLGPANYSAAVRQTPLDVIAHHLPPGDHPALEPCRQKANMHCAKRNGRDMPGHQERFCRRYYRVSTERQGRSGLRLAAQQAAVAGFINGGTELVAEFTEIESGKRDERPALAKALEACRRHKARLVIAKLDRLSRNLAFIATLMESGVEFVAVDNPHAIS